MVIAATIAGSKSLPQWEPLHRFEQWLFTVTRPLHSDRKIALSADISALGSSTLVAALAIVGSVGMLIAHRPRDAVVLSAVSALAGASGTWLKRVTRRARPETATSAMFGSSFPSSHTLMGTALWITVGAMIGSATYGALHVWVWIVTVSIVILIGLSRVFLHVHYLSDVVAGWAVGAALAVGGVLWRAG